MQLAPILKSHQLVINPFSITPLHCNVLCIVLSPVPVAEIISSDHRTAQITHFLNKWVLTCKAVLHKDLKTGQIEMDHS